MIRGREGLGEMTGCRAVAEAVGVVTEEGTSLGHVELRELIGIFFRPLAVV